MKEPPNGSFEFEGLEPNIYILRIVFPCQSQDLQTGRHFDLYLEREVDLRFGDVVLPERIVTLDEIFSVSSKRD